ncbi:type I-F CRISPR-associated endoribonuclease Cas6/Csy4 [Pseudomonas panipatensis]|uniref:type I-F CRISPR-associated endoribonuclease Cas6/Csy4 n=1 Tax=Pseudomonas panipatensis TaxID=428992 RepID=UPI0035B0CAE0
MDHYLDIRLRPDPEFPAMHLMSALFAKLHRALVALPNENIGVSFPDVDEQRPWLGERLRLHGSAAALDRLMAQPWLNGMRDHLRQGDCLAVPAQALYRQVRRVQTKSSPERLRRRQMRRHGLSEEEARQRIPDHSARSLDLPYLHLASQSTGQRFRLFIQHGPLLAEPIDGACNRYGLGEGATVPWF